MKFCGKSPAHRVAKCFKLFLKFCLELQTQDITNSRHQKLKTTQTFRRHFVLNEHLLEQFIQFSKLD